jgi:hypothetical protein
VNNFALQAFAIFGLGYNPIYSTTSTTAVFERGNRWVTLYSDVRI